METVCYVTLFGGLQMRRGDRRVVQFRTYKTGALLAYLAYWQARPHSREVLAGLFWPDATADAGRLSLRVALNALRRQLEPPGVLPGTVLLTTRDTVQVHPDAVQTDVAEFDAFLECASKAATVEARLDAWTRAAARCTGELLPGFYEEWILPERSRCAARALDTISRISNALHELGDASGAIEYGLRAIAAAPFDEHLHLAVMNHYAGAGRPEDALLLYAEFERNLQQHCGAAPSRDLSRLADELRHAATQTSGQQAMRRHAPSNGASEAAAPNLRTDAADGAGGANGDGRPQPSSQANLPTTITRFFGRDREIEALVALATEVDSPARLITLTGPGGVGKTRLAVEAARCMASGPDTPVIFVPLADTDDPGKIASAIADALNLQRTPDAEPLDQVVQALAGRGSVLIMDNAEHLLAEKICAVDPSAIRAARTRERSCRVFCGWRRTDDSRHLTAVAGAHGRTRGPGPSAPVPRPPDAARTGAGFEAEPALDCPSVQMFLDRAKAARSDFQWTERSGAAVAAICARLEGLPLSIELAAAWSRTLSPAQILARLSRQEDLLVSRKKDVPARHISLRTTIQWSFDLLSPELRRFFARLSVFRSGWTVEMAEEVCEAPDALDAIAELQSRSMALAEECGAAIRCRLLEALREFAADQLEPPDRDRLARRHALWMLRMAERAHKGLTGPDQQSCQSSLAAEQDNLRAALAWSLRAGPAEDDRQDDGAFTLAGERERVEIGLRLAGALGTFWQICGQVVEGRQWLESALSFAGPQPPAARAAALAADADLAVTQGNDAQAAARAEEALQLYRRLEDVPGCADMLLLLSTMAYRLGDADRGERLLAESLALCRQSGYRRGLASALKEHGRREGFRGEYATAEARLGESRALFEAIGDLRGVAETSIEHAIVLGYRQEYLNAIACNEEALALYRSLDDRLGISWATFGIGYLARIRGDHALATVALEEHLSLQRQMLSKKGTAIALRNLGCVARDRGDFARAAALLEEALAIFRESGEQQGIAETVGSLGVVALYRADYRAARTLHEECLRFRREQGLRQDIAELLCFLGRVNIADGDNGACARASDGEPCAGPKCGQSNSYHERSAGSLRSMPARNGLCDGGGASERIRPAASSRRMRPSSKSMSWRRWPCSIRRKGSGSRRRACWAAGSSLHPFSLPQAAVPPGGDRPGGSRDTAASGARSLCRSLGRGSSNEFGAGRRTTFGGQAGGPSVPLRSRWVQRRWGDDHSHDALTGLQSRRIGKIAVRIFALAAAEVEHARPVGIGDPRRGGDHADDEVEAPLRGGFVGIGAVDDVRMVGGSRRRRDRAPGPPPATCRLPICPGWSRVGWAGRSACAGPAGPCGGCRGGRACSRCAAWTW